DAAAWVVSDPWYSPYRLALARALAREDMPRLAIAHFDTLLSRPAIGRLPDRGTLLRELADAYVAAGDRLGGAERLRGALAVARARCTSPRARAPRTMCVSPLHPRSRSSIAKSDRH